PTPSGDPAFRPADYAGEYRSPQGAEFSVEAAGNGLFMNRSSRRIALLPAGKDQFFVKDSALEKFYLKFGRQNDQVVEALHGNDWHTNSRYSGPREFQYPKEWEAFAGRYRNDSPWWGTGQIFLRKGKLWIGDDALFPLDNGLFRVGEEEYSPERVSFDG